MAPPPAVAAPNGLGTTNSSGSVEQPPSLHDALIKSTKTWQEDLQSLFNHAKDRFPDVVWELHNDEDSVDRADEVWGHKAVVYARAPPSFQARYFSFKPPPVASPTPTPYSSSSSPTPQHPAQQSSLSLSLSLGVDFPSPSRSPSPSHYSQHQNQNGYRSQSPVPSTTNTLTNAGGLMRIPTFINPTLFSNELEYLYTGKGLGQAFEFLFDSTEVPSEDGDGEETRIDKLRKDLVFMWRSRLYSDVRITLEGNFHSSHHSHLSAGGEREKESATAIFSSHRFILVSRSPYFHTRLLSPHWNPTSLSPHKSTLHALSSAYNNAPNEPLTINLPSPPFTPASVFFTLGYIYAGTLVFSHRTYDLDTAFAVMRAATFLEMQSLYDEVQGRVVTEMCHGLFHAFLEFVEYERVIGGKWGVGGCRCRQCSRRVPRVLEFALAPDVQNPHLERGARRALVGLFGEGWTTPEFGRLDKRVRDGLVKGVGKRTTPINVLPILWASERALARLEGIVDVWGESVREGVAVVRKGCDEVLCNNAEAVFGIGQGTQLDDEDEDGEVQGAERGEGGKGVDDWEELMEAGGDGFGDGERVSWVMDSVRRGLNEKNAAVVYQTLVSSILLRPHPTETELTLLPSNSSIRTLVEETRMDVLRWLRKRWMGVRAEGGFDSLEGWSLKEISHEIEVSVEDLLTPPTGPSRGTPTRSGLRPVLTNDTDTASAYSFRTTQTAQTGHTQRGKTKLPTPKDRFGGGASIRSGMGASSKSTTSLAKSVVVGGGSGGGGRNALSPSPSKMSMSTTTSSASRTTPRPLRVMNLASQTSSSSLGGMVVGGLRPDSKLTPAGSFVDSESGSLNLWDARESLVEVDEVGGGGGDERGDEGDDEDRPDVPRENGDSATGHNGTATSHRPHGAISPRPRGAISPRPHGATSPRLRGAISPQPSLSSVHGRRKGALGDSSDRPKSLAASVKSKASTVRKTSPAGPSTLRPPPAHTPRPTSTNRASTLSVTSDASTTFKTAPERQSSLTTPDRQSSLTTPDRQSGLSLGARVRRISTASSVSTASAKTNSKTTPAPAPSVPKVVRPRRPSVGSTTSAVSVGASKKRPAVSPVDQTKLSAPSLKSPSMVSVRSVSSGASASASASASSKRNVVRRGGSNEKSTGPAPDRSSKASVSDQVSVRSGVVGAKGKSAVRGVVSHDKKDSTASSSSTVTVAALKRKGSADTITESTVASDKHDSPRIPPESLQRPESRQPSPLKKATLVLEPKGVTLDIGIPCIISSKRARFRAYARYIGEVEGELGPWVGVEVPVDDSWTDEKLHGRQWNDGSWGGIRYFELGSAGSEWDYGDDRVVKRRRFNFPSGQVRDRGVKRDGDQLNVDRVKRLRSVSPAMSDASNLESRGLFVRPQQVLYVVDAVGSDL
ncbi:hypothetical protein JAAARDRAFT_161813 [Jaapia argillacea MUCL 33604]|uniref:CAP-Gly domain-containing protein n=1 Tax=Jaapia argillacea MUCL 33604 TaxID=933084 RepID=A0A067PEU5_9AGAM|nr:hypothetical protein JAAARDRAFT_161813 [Jaapia argillacea MUCL 33604]